MTAPDAGTPDPAALDVDNLAPTHYLILEVLAARYRLGEALWTFPSRPAIVVALDKLAELDLVGWKGGVAPKTVQAWLTNTGRREALSETYEPPADAETRTEWGVRWHDPRPASYFPQISSDYGSEEKAREFAEAYGEPEGVVVHRRRWVGPWLPAPTNTEESV